MLGAAAGQEITRTWGGRGSGDLRSVSPVGAVRTAKPVGHDQYGFLLYFSLVFDRAGAARLRIRSPLAQGTRSTRSLEELRE